MSKNARGRGKGHAQRGRHVKRQEFEDEDGWTVITHGVSRMTLDKTSTQQSSCKNGRTVKHATDGLPSQIVQDLTTERLFEQFEKMREQYKESVVARQISKLLDKKDLHVEEAVCVGIGSFSRDWQHRYRSLWQLVLFVDAVGKFETLAGKMRRFAQDPAFTALDIAFLELLDVKVVTKDMRKYISDATFAFSPFVDWFLLLPTFLEGKNPALYIGNEILDDYSAFASSEEKQRALKECNELGKAFLQDRESVKLQEFEYHTHALNGMVFYTRKAIDEIDRTET